MSSINIPFSITTIGLAAFDGTAWLESQPDGVVYAGLVAYQYKGNMPNGTIISIKDGTISIASSAFNGCNGLTSVNIPHSVTSIGYGAFEGCSGLTSVFYEYQFSDEPNVLVQIHNSKKIVVNPLNLAKKENGKNKVYQLNIDFDNKETEDPQKLANIYETPFEEGGYVMKVSESIEDPKGDL